MDAQEVFTGWASGRYSGEAADRIGYAVAYAKSQCSDRIAEPLYTLYAVGASGVEASAHIRATKDWAYKEAASYASRGRQRYRLDWGHQAARDGLCLALWPDDIRLFAELPSNEQRAKQFGVGLGKYQRLRRHIQSEATKLIGEFHGFFDAATKPE